MVEIVIRPARVKLGIQWIQCTIIYLQLIFKFNLISFFYQDLTLVTITTNIS